MKTEEGEFRATLISTVQNGCTKQLAKVLKNDDEDDMTTIMAMMSRVMML